MAIKKIISYLVMYIQLNKILQNKFKIIKTVLMHCIIFNYNNII